MEKNPRSEARAALSYLLDRFAYLALTLGALAAVFGLMRVMTRGWHTNVITDLALYVLMVVVLLLRKRLPVEVVFSVLIGLATATAFASFLTLGLGTMSFVGLTACCVAVSVVVNARAGFLFLGGSVVVASIIGYAVCTGRLTGLQVTDPYLFEPQTWATQIASFAAYTVVILIVVGATQNRLSRTVDEVTRQAEELRESEHRYRLIADNMKDVLFTQNMRFEIEYTSPSVERLFGYTPEEFAGMNAEDAFAPSSRQRALESYQHFLAMAQEGRFEIPPMEFEYLRKDGSTFWGEVTPTFLRDETGRLTGVQGLLRDITPRKQIEQERHELELELRQAEKLNAIGELAGGIAHDFNNQLAPIVAYADLLARGLADEKSVASHARKILRPARNAAELTGKLLAFARKGTYEQRPLDMHDVINEVVEILRHSIDKRIRIKRYYEAESAVVNGDQGQLQNTVLNLALNARDAMPDGGEIVLKTRSTKLCNPEGDVWESWLVISVEDTGEGIDDAILGRVFEPFFTTKEPGKGTGMGLSAAYGTVVSHGGRIEISKRASKGTAVSVFLPVSSQAAGVRADTLAGTISTGYGKALVVDDEDGVRVALRELLETLGYTVETVGSAEEATAFYADHWAAIDVVVLDLVLPDMNGRQVLGVMRGINPDARVLLVSGYTADDEIQRLLEDRVTEFLEKPFLLADLAESLARLRG